MVDQGRVRASGQTAASEEAIEVAKEIEGSLDEPMPEDKPRSKHRTPGFARMRTDWRSEDRPVIQRALGAVEGRIQANFGGAIEIMNEVYDIVREPMVDEHGVVQTDQWGWTIWKRNGYGGFVEDFTLLTARQKEHLLFKITTRVYEWEQVAADAWGEAMLAKAAFEEQFAIGFDAPASGTVDDRKTAGNLEARDERYFAIFMSMYSRRADSIVRALTLLGQRLRDTLA